jgi:hypothetical protein
MRISKIAVMIVALFLSGCAGMDAAMEYNDVTVREMHFGGDTWRIFDKPAEGRLMITPSMERAMGGGFLSGLTFGAADTDIPKPEYQRAVEAWLRMTKRRCTVLDGYKLIKPQWEFKYHCP